MPHRSDGIVEGCAWVSGIAAGLKSAPIAFSAGILRDVSGYRSDDDAVRARLDAAIEAWQRARSELDEHRRAFALLNEQLARKSLRGMDDPAPEAIGQLPPDPSGLSLTELIELTGRLEVETERIRAARDRLAESVQLLSRRAGGETVDTSGRLSRPPRDVPAVYLLAELLPFRWFYVWVLGMWATVVGPGIVAALSGIFGERILPSAIPSVGLVVLVGLGGYHARTAIRRLGILRWGRVATVIRSSSTESDTTSYSSMPVPCAVGWVVDRSSYTGYEYTNTIEYATDEGERGTCKFKGREYAGGHVLYDTRKPSVALPVEDFAYDLEPNAQGRWPGMLRIGLWVSMLATAVIVSGWIAGVWLVSRLAIS